MSALSRALSVARRQAPVLAVVWAVHAVFLVFLWWTRVPGQVPVGHRAAMLLALAALLAIEWLLLSAAGAALELFARWLPTGVLDALKAISVSGLVAALAASSLKYHATSVHLKESDLWFARNSLLQILQEASWLEAVSILSLPIGALLLALSSFLGLRAARGWRERLSWRAVGTLAVVALVTLAIATSASRPVRLLFRDVVPETYRLSGSQDFQRPRGADAVTAGDGGRAIVPYEPAALERPKNVVIVMLESIPWGRTSFGGWRSGVTPHLEALAEESILFSSAYTTSTHSDYAQMAILSSLHPRKFDRHDYYTDLSYPRTLIWDAVKSVGYSTAMFSCQNETWGNMLRYLHTPGLDVLRHSLSWPRARRRGRGSESKVYEETPVEEWIAWRRSRRDEPYLTYLNFQSNHFPYEAPPEAPRPFRPFEVESPISFLRYPKDEIPTMLNRFDNALHYADAQLGRIVDHLRESGEWERTALVVVSDHGEAFYEHDEPTHGTSLYEEQVRSFLMMRLPGEPARRIDEPVSLLDMAPVLLDYLGLPPHGNFQGRGDVTEPGYSAAGRPFFFTIQGLTFEDGLLLDDWKYVVNWDRRFRRLFSLASDPEERTNLVEAELARAEAMDRRLREFLGRQLAYYRDRGWEAGRYPPSLESEFARSSRSPAPPSPPTGRG